MLIPLTLVKVSIRDILLKMIIPMTLFKMLILQTPFKMTILEELLKIMITGSWLKSEKFQRHFFFRVPGTQVPGRCFIQQVREKI